MKDASNFKVHIAQLLRWVGALDWGREPNPPEGEKPMLLKYNNYSSWRQLQKFPKNSLELKLKNNGECIVQDGEQNETKQYSQLPIIWEEHWLNNPRKSDIPVKTKGTKITKTHRETSYSFIIFI